MVLPFSLIPDDICGNKNRLCFEPVFCYCSKYIVSAQYFLNCVSQVIYISSPYLHGLFLLFGIPGFLRIGKALAGSPLPGRFMY